jgi:hypothetical protein
MRVLRSAAQNILDFNSNSDTVAPEFFDSAKPSPDRKGVIPRVPLVVLSLYALKELAQNGVRRGPVPGPFGGARRTLCASSLSRLGFAARAKLAVWVA